MYRNRKGEPLVSIAVITYNSANFILETLESTKNQLYANIELIISDDCSKDDTLEICEIWLNQNVNRFVHSKIVKGKENKGIASNMNKGIQHSNGDWIKFIGGDDILLPNCISDNIKHILSRSDIKILFSQLRIFYNEYDPLNDYPIIPNKVPMNIMDPAFSAEDQYKRLLLSDRITYTPTSFFNREVLLKFGGFDESVPYIEDYPMWLTLTKNGIRLNFMKKVTVAYRMHEKSLNSKMHKGIFNQQYLRTELMRKKYIYPYLPWDIVGKMKFNYTFSKMLDRLGINNNTDINQNMYKFAIVYLNPFQYVYSIKRHILKYKENSVFYYD